MKNVKKIISVVALLALCGSILAPQFVGASNAVCPPGSTSAVCDNSRTIEDVIKIIVNTLLFLAGVVSVIVIIIAGIRMTASSGNADSMAKARNSIIFAALGVVVTIAAYSIVNFVILRATT